VDITYLPMRRGFLYLVAIMDWYTRMVQSWRISNTLEADFCVEALNEAIYRFGPPDIMNTPFGIMLRITLPGNGSGIAVHILRPHKALGGRPPAVVYLRQIKATQPDQQEQIRA